MILGQVGTIKRELTFVEPGNLELLPNSQTETQLCMVPSSDRAQCEVCGAKFLATNKLAQHMCAHYMGQVKLKSQSEKKDQVLIFFQLRDLGSLYSDLTCLSCEFAFTTEHALLLHIGLKHRLHLSLESHCNLQF